MTTTESARFHEMIAEVKSQSDRGCALIIAANLDNRLSALLKAFCVDLGKDATKSIYEGNGFLGSFSAKISLCYMLGLLAENEYHDLELIRKIRNFFAHEEHGWDFQTEAIRSRCLSLQLVHGVVQKMPDLAEDYKNPRDAFVLAGASLSLLILHRAQEAAKTKRTSPPPGRIL